MPLEQRTSVPRGNEEDITESHEAWQERKVTDCVVRFLKAERTVWSPGVRQVIATNSREVGSGASHPFQHQVASTQRSVL